MNNQDQDNCNAKQETTSGGPATYGLGNYPDRGCVGNCSTPRPLRVTPLKDKLRQWLRSFIGFEYVFNVINAVDVTSRREHAHAYQRSQGEMSRLDEVQKRAQENSTRLCKQAERTTELEQFARRATDHINKILDQFASGSVASAGRVRQLEQLQFSVNEIKSVYGSRLDLHRESVDKLNLKIDKLEKTITNLNEALAQVVAFSNRKSEQVATLEAKVEALRASSGLIFDWEQAKPAKLRAVKPSRFAKYKGDCGS